MLCGMKVVLMGYTGRRGPEVDGRIRIIANGTLT